MFCFTESIMVRNRIRKTEPLNEDDVRKAVLEVVDQNKELRKTAYAYGIKPSTLFYRIKNERKRRNAVEDHQELKDYTRYSSLQSTSQVFTTEEEQLLQKYILKCSQMNYGLTYKQIRLFAYDYAKKLNKPICSKWDEKKEAGIEWLKGFMKRNPILTLRKPENTSLNRALNFTKANVEEFFANYERALLAKNFGPGIIYNLDETGISTVLSSPRIVAKKGVKQVGQVTSAERGTSITMCGIISATGNSIPPVFIFPKANFKNNWLKDAPPGSLGLANSPRSGWMTKELFVKVLEHIIKFTGCTNENPILVLMDNHETHCSLEAVSLAKSNGIVLVTFPPHTSHRLQPLDVAVYSPFKTKLAVAINDWMLSNSGCRLNIEDLPGRVKIAYEATFTIKNITEGFRKPGIWPVNKLAFGEGDFDASLVSSPEPVNIATPSTSTSEPSGENPDGFPEASKKANLEAGQKTPVKKIAPSFVSPEEVRPFPSKALSTNVRKNTRKKVKSRVLTETPEKDKIEEETLARIEKKKQAEMRKKMVEDRKLKRKLDQEKLNNNFTKQTKTKKTKKQRDSSESDIESESGIQYDDSTDTETFSEDSNKANLHKNASCSSNLTSFNIFDYVVVQFNTKKSVKHYVGQIIDKTGFTEYTVNFMKKQGEGMKFIFPDIRDTSLVEVHDLVLKLPIPTTSGCTSRTTEYSCFDIDLTRFNLS